MLFLITLYLAFGLAVGELSLWGIRNAKGHQDTGFIATLAYFVIVTTWPAVLIWAVWDTVRNK